MARTDPRDKPVLELKALELYEAMVERAETREVGDEKFLLYEGQYSHLFNQVVGNLTYYTPIRKILIETGSVSLVQRGNKNRDTVFVLHHAPPPQDEWPQDLTGVGVSATMRVEFEKRLASLEAWRENLTGGGKLNLLEALRNFEDRLSKLERQLGQLAKEGKVTNGKST